MDRDQRQEWLELYRPDDPDPDMPRSAELQQDPGRSSDLQRRWRTIVESDARIGEALAAISVPPDLKARIVSQVERQEKEVIRVRRRRRWIAFVGSAAAALVVVGVWWWQHRRPAWTPDAVARKAAELYTKELDWVALADSDVSSAWPTGWARSRCRGSAEVDFLGRRLLAFEFAATGRRARVFVIPLSYLAADFSWTDYYYPAAPPFVSFSQGDDHMFVAVAEEKSDFDLFQGGGVIAFIDRTRQPGRRL
jgi:hypothetical protein